MIKKIVAWGLLLFVPGLAFGAIEINEIMYDLSGADDGREWVEIINTGSETVDLDGWKFFEADTKHGLTVAQGDLNLGSGDLAVIVADPAKFLADWPGFNGTLLDSSFSLSNTGEPLSLLDASLADQGGVAYDASLGAAGTGESLQQFDDGWRASLPTPGRENELTQPPAPEPEPEPEPEEDDGAADSDVTEDEDPPPPAAPPLIKGAVIPPAKETKTKTDPDQEDKTKIAPKEATAVTPTQTREVSPELLARLRAALSPQPAAVAMVPTREDLPLKEEVSEPPKEKEKEEVVADESPQTAAVIRATTSEMKEPTGPIVISKKLTWWQRLLRWLFGR